MERGQHHAQFRGVGEEGGVPRALRSHRDIVAHEAAHEIDERAEQQQYPADAEQVEEHVGEGGAARLRVCRERGDVRGHGGADVLAHHERDALVDGQHAARAEYHCYRHDGCRRLHAHGEDAADYQEHERGGEARGVERREEVEHRLVLAEVHVDARLAQRAEAEEHERHAEEEVAHVLALLVIYEDKGDEECRIHEVGYVEREPRRHDPCRERGADVGAHDHRYCLCQGEQPGVDERHGHHRGGC